MLALLEPVDQIDKLVRSGKPIIHRELLQRCLQIRSEMGACFESGRSANSRDESADRPLSRRAGNVYDRVREVRIAQFTQQGLHARNSLAPSPA
jgi:hypothetical protein